MVWFQALTNFYYPPSCLKNRSKVTRKNDLDSLTEDVSEFLKHKIRSATLAYYKARQKNRGKYLVKKIALICWEILICLFQKYLHHFLSALIVYKIVTKWYFIYYGLRHACTTYSPWAKCGPRKLLMWPVNAIMYFFLLVCLMETPLNQGKIFVVQALWNSK